MTAMWVPAVVVMVAVFLLAMYGDLSAPAALNGALGAFGLPRLFAVVLLGAEAAVVTALILAPAAGLIAAVVFLVAVTAPFAWRSFRRQPLPDDCGCFGSALPDHGTTWLYGRNAALIGVAALGATTAPSGIGWIGVVVAAAVGASVMIAAPAPKSDRVDTPQIPRPS